jgi:hypothetical protein
MNRNSIFLSQPEQKDLRISPRILERMPTAELSETVDETFSQRFADALDRPDCFTPPKFGPLPDYERQLDRLLNLSCKLAEMVIISEMEREFNGFLA